jgi:IclR family acetate operon transcriptional repressor
MPVSNSSARFLFDMMELLGRTDAPMGLTDVRKALSLPVATAHRGLATLEQAGFAERYQASTRYVLGPMAKRLRQSVISRFAVRDRALPYLRRLSVTTGETTSLSIRIGWFMLRLAAVPGPGDIVKRPAVGQVTRLDSELAGRVILTLCPEQELDRFTRYCRRQGLPVAASWRVDEPALQSVGYVMEPVAAKPGSMVAAMPLRDNERNAVAVISVEISDAAAWQAELGTALQDVARSIGPVESHYAHLDPDTIGLSDAVT